MKGETTRGLCLKCNDGRGAVLRGRRTSGTEVPSRAPRTDENDASTRLAPAPRCGSSGDPRAQGPVSTEPGLAPESSSLRPALGHLAAGVRRWGGGRRTAPRARPPGSPSGRGPALPGALTPASRAPPGAPPAPTLPRCPAGPTCRRRERARTFRGRLLAPGEPGPGTKAPAARRSAPRPAPRAFAAPARRPQSLRPARGRTLAERRRKRARRRVAGVNVPDVGRVGAASPSAAGTLPPPSPAPERRAGRRRRKCHHLLSGGGWPPELRLAGSDRSHAPNPAPDPAPSPIPSHAPNPQVGGRFRAPPRAPPSGCAVAEPSRAPGSRVCAASWADLPPGAVSRSPPTAAGVHQRSSSSVHWSQVLTAKVTAASTPDGRARPAASHRLAACGQASGCPGAHPCTTRKDAVSTQGPLPCHLQTRETEVAA